MFENFLKKSKELIINFILGILGLFFGILNNIFSLYIQHIFNITNILLKLSIHLFISCFFLVLLNGYLHLFLIWKNHTSKLFFMTFFFGVQYNIFSSTIERIFAIFEEK
jgi:hypothetical protein